MHDFAAETIHAVALSQHEVLETPSQVVCSVLQYEYQYPPCSSCLQVFSTSPGGRHHPTPTLQVSLKLLPRLISLIFSRPY